MLPLPCKKAGTALVKAMHQQEIVLVVARAQNGVIGRDGTLPWHIPADLRHFKMLTQGTPMIMGRRTFESLPGLLPDRRHIILTRDRAWKAAGAEIAATPAEALALAGDVPKISVIGGAEVFALFLPIATRVELTEIHAEVEGDTAMPDPRGLDWVEIARVPHDAEGDRPAYSFVTLARHPLA